MWERIKVSGNRYVHVLVAGLFTGRIISELWATTIQPSHSGVHPAAILLVTTLSTLLAALLLGRFRLNQCWALLFFTLYIFYPEADFKVALSAIALAIIPLLQKLRANRSWTQLKWFPAFSLLLPALFFFFLYLATIAPDILTADNGEFQLVSTNLGVAHPPGFPLYTLLGHLAVKLPFPAAPAFKVNFLSLITSTATLAILYLAVHKITQRPLAGATAVTALGSSTTFWSQATTANIRSLTALFAISAFYGAFLFWDAKRKNIRPDKGDGYLTFVALSLSFGVFHHASLLFMGLVILIFILAADTSLLKSVSRWKRPLFACLISLLPWLYLPWRGLAVAKGGNIWGATAELATVKGFLNHALALGFQGDFFYFMEPAVLWERIKVMGNVMTFQFSPLLLAGMGVGLGLMIWRQRPLAWLLGVSFAIHTFITATYRAPQTVEYMMPAYLPAVICLGYAVGTLGKIEWRWNIIGEFVSPAFASIMLVSVGYQVFSHYTSYRLLHQDTSARNYAAVLLDQAPAEAVILTDWHWATPLWYLQEVEGKRLDATIQFVFPTAEPYGETWSRLIKEEMENGRPVIATHFDENAYADLPAFEPIGEAFLFRQEPRTAMPPSFIPLDLILGELIQIAGYHLEPASVEIGREAVLTLAWRPVSSTAMEEKGSISLFAHLVGVDGRIYGQEDPPARSQPEGLSLTQFYLSPRLGAAPGDFAIMVGAYGEEPLLTREGVSRTRIATLNVTSMPQQPVTNNPVNRQVAGQRPLVKLLGYDWDNTFPDQSRLYLHWKTEAGFHSEVLENTTAESLYNFSFLGAWGIREDNWSLKNDGVSHYIPFGQGIVWTGPLLKEGQLLRPGDEVVLRQSFQSDRPVVRDIATSVRLVGFDEDGFHWDWWKLDDEFGVPAMGAIPTLKWIAGSMVNDVHRLSVAETAYPGQTAGVILGLHDTFTNRPLPIFDERVSQGTPWQLTKISP